MISDTMSGMILVYLLNVLILDMTIVIQVLRSCSTDFTFHGFRVTVGTRYISLIQLIVMTSAHRALVDITPHLGGKEKECKKNLKSLTN